MAIIVLWTTCDIENHRTELGDIYQRWVRTMLSWMQKTFEKFFLASMMQAMRIEHWRDAMVRVTSLDESGSKVVFWFNEKRWPIHHPCARH